MIVSYSQNLEDILLHRALCHVECGFYIDVGANDPVIDSVTKLFYDAGWRGVNVDPNQHFIDLLNAKRPNDINVRAAASDRAGITTFHQMGGWAHGLSTTIGEVAKERAHLLERSYDVPTETLTAICARYAPPDIHFLKVDAEGAEALVFRGLDLARFRPWVIVGEISHDESWWPLLTESGYTFARADAANRYYIANERAAELLPAFAFAVDDYKRFHSKDVDDALLLRHKPLRWITKQVRAAISGSGEA